MPPSYCFINENVFIQFCIARSEETTYKVMPRCACILTNLVAGNLQFVLSLLS